MGTADRDDDLIPVPRRAQLIDLPQIAAIEAESYPNPWPEEFFGRCLDLGYDFWVIRSSSRVDAYAVMAVFGGVGHLMNLCVRPAARRNGLGRSLLSHLLELLRSQSCGLFLEVRKSNLAAQNLYQSAGLQILGLRLDYYDSDFERDDAVIMARPWGSFARRA
jgi:ribosomal-protein-alanine N-acetyltransferase